jgi:hypothetical protein
MTPIRHFSTRCISSARAAPTQLVWRAAFQCVLRLFIVSKTHRTDTFARCATLEYCLNVERGFSRAFDHHTMGYGNDLATRIGVD